MQQSDSLEIAQTSGLSVVDQYESWVSAMLKGRQFNHLLNEYQAILDEFKDVSSERPTLLRRLLGKMSDSASIMRRVHRWTNNLEAVNKFSRVSVEATRKNYTLYFLCVITTLHLTRELFNAVESIKGNKARRPSRNITQKESANGVFNEFIKFSEQMICNDGSIQNISVKERIALLNLFTQLTSHPVYMHTDALGCKIDRIRSCLLDAAFLKNGVIGFMQRDVDADIRMLRHAMVGAGHSNQHHFYVNQLPAIMKSLGLLHVMPTLDFALAAPELATGSKRAAFCRGYIETFHDFLMRPKSPTTSWGMALHYNTILNTCIASAMKLQQHLSPNDVAWIASLKPYDVNYFGTQSFANASQGYEVPARTCLGLLTVFYMASTSTMFKPKIRTLEEAENHRSAEYWGFAYLTVAYGAYYLAYGINKDIMTVPTPVPLSEAMQLPDWLKAMIAANTGVNNASSDESVAVQVNPIVEPVVEPVHNAELSLTKAEPPLTKEVKIALFKQTVSIMKNCDPRAEALFKVHGSDIYAGTMRKAFSDETRDEKKFINDMRNVVGQWLGRGGLPMRMTPAKATVSSAPPSYSSTANLMPLQTKPTPSAPWVLESAATSKPFIFRFHRHADDVAEGLSLDMHIQFFDQVSRIRAEMDSQEVLPILLSAGKGLAGVSTEIFDLETQGDMLTLVQFYNQYHTSEIVSDEVIKGARTAAENFLMVSGCSVPSGTGLRG